jgi:cholesterol transport system auxiliary component
MISAAPGRRSYAALTALLACVLFVGSCALPRDTRVARALYDLGELPSEARGKPHFAVTLLVPAIGAPAWLDTTGIAYRLAYEDPARIRTYANSRWVDTPATLITEELRTCLAAASNRVVEPGDGAHADYALRVELEDFSQTFDAPDHSRVSARVRASVVNLAARTVEAQKTFRTEQPAAPNAAGAAAALAQASHVLIDNVLDWAAQNLKNKPPRQTGGYTGEHTLQQDHQARTSR